MAGYISSVSQVARLVKGEEKEFKPTKIIELWKEQLL